MCTNLQHLLADSKLQSTLLKNWRIHSLQKSTFKVDLPMTKVLLCMLLIHVLLPQNRIPPLFMEVPYRDKLFLHRVKLRVYQQRMPIPTVLLPYNHCSHLNNYQYCRNCLWIVCILMHSPEFQEISSMLLFREYATWREVIDLMCYTYLQKLWVWCVLMVQTPSFQPTECLWVWLNTSTFSQLMLSIRYTCMYMYINMRTCVWHCVNVCICVVSN